MDVTAKAGVLIADEKLLPGDSADMVVRDADAAVHRAKRGGPGICQVVNDEMCQEAVDFMEVKRGIHAWVNNEFEMYYQPIDSSETGEFMSMEALVVWYDPKRSLTSPDAFTPIAGSTGMIISIGEWVLHKFYEQISI